MAGERVKPEKIVLIENGIDLARSQLSSEQKAELRKSLGLKEDHVVFLTVGRLAQEKGHTVLLEAISQVGDDPAFLFAGDGPLRAQLEERADQLGIQPRVRFLGVRDDVPALLGIADGFIQPSLSEGLSLAFLEALAAGVPVISSRVGGAVDIIEEHDAGILVPAGDAAALAAAIAQLAGDAQLRARLGRAGQAAVQQRYSVERMCGQYATLFDELSHER
jgi:glycosyltransferase involved in cell wall biosynthesis